MDLPIRLYLGTYPASRWLCAPAVTAARAQNFAEQGYDTSDAIADLDEADLDAIGVTLPGHKKRLLMAAKRYSPDDPVVKPKVVKALPSYENWGGDVAGSL